MTRNSKRQLEYTTATHAIERLTPSRDALHLCAQVPDEQVSTDTAVETLLHLYDLKRISANG